MVIKRPYVYWCSTRLYADNAPNKLLPENDNSKLRAHPEDKTDGATSFSR